MDIYYHVSHEPLSLSDIALALKEDALTDRISYAYFSLWTSEVVLNPKEIQDKQALIDSLADRLILAGHIPNPLTVYNPKGKNGANTIITPCIAFSHLAKRAILALKYKYAAVTLIEVIDFAQSINDRDSIDENAPTLFKVLSQIYKTEPQIALNGYNQLLCLYRPDSKGYCTIEALIKQLEIPLSNSANTLGALSLADLGKKARLYLLNPVTPTLPLPPPSWM